MMKRSAPAALCVLGLLMAGPLRAKQAAAPPKPFATPPTLAPSNKYATNQDLASLKKEVESLRSQLSDLQSDLQQLKSLFLNLNARPNPSPAPPTANPASAMVDIGGAPFKGNKNAKLTLIEFSDYQ